MFMQVHGTKVEVQQCQCNHGNKGQKRIEVIRNCTDEQFQTIIAFYNAGYGCRPGRNGCDDADRRRCRINDVSQFRAGNVMCVCNGTHNAADGQTVEIVVYEYQNAQQECGKQRAFSGFDYGRRPFAVCGGTAGFVHEGNQNTQYNQEDQDTAVIAVCYVGKQTAAGLICDHNDESFFDIKVCVEQCTGHDTYKQGGKNFLCDQCQNDCNQWRYQRPEGCVHVACNFRCFPFRTECGNGKEQQNS